MYAPEDAGYYNKTIPGGGYLLAVLMEIINSMIMYGLIVILLKINLEL